jgi:hypothetical protein
LLQHSQGGQHTFIQDNQGLVRFHKKSNPAKNLAGPYQSCKGYSNIDKTDCQKDFKVRKATPGFLTHPAGPSFLAGIQNG